MRVLIVSQYFWPESFIINDLARSLVLNGQKVTVLTGKPNYPEGKIAAGYKVLGIQQELHEGVRVIRVPIVPRGNGVPWRLALNYLSFIFSGAVLAPWTLRGVKFDVVFVYAPSPLLQALPAVFISWLKGVPLVVWVQDLWPESLVATGYVKNRIVLKAVEILVRYIYRRADSILIQSEAFRDPVARLTEDVLKIRYYPNTAPSHDIAEQIIDTKLVSHLRKYFSVVFAGNLGAAQSLETIISAAECLNAQQEIRFFIIGSGSREAWLAEEVDRRKLSNVVLTGRLSNNQMPAVFSASSALLLTLADSPALALTIPSKLQAYFAAGRPVIASLNGEGARIIRDAEAGLACPAGDSEALAAAVLELYRLAPNDRKRLGGNGRRYFEEHFELSRRLDELIKQFRSVLRHRKVDDQ